jgi:proteasome lid subunit RPN8/RPN11
VIDELARCAAGVLETIREHAQREAPLECCGLLITVDGVLETAIPARNCATDPSRRYEVDPADYFAALRRYRGTPAVISGAYHSHPRSSPVPSPTDLEQAFSEFLYLIAGPLDGSQPVEIRAYRLTEGNFRSIRLVPAPEELQ